VIHLAEVGGRLLGLDLDGRQMGSRNFRLRGLSGQHCANMQAVVRSGDGLLRLLKMHIGNGARGGWRSGRVRFMMHFDC
jgi:hypothetical protein